MNFLDKLRNGVSQKPFMSHATVALLCVWLGYSQRDFIRFVSWEIQSSWQKEWKENDNSLHGDDFSAKLLEPSDQFSIKDTDYLVDFEGKLEYELRNMIDEEIGKDKHLLNLKDNGVFYSFNKTDFENNYNLREWGFFITYPDAVCLDKKLNEIIQKSSQILIVKYGFSFLSWQKLSFYYWFNQDIGLIIELGESWCDQIWNDIGSYVETIERLSVETDEIQKKLKFK